MNLPDLINGVFEGGGAYWLTQDVRALRKHKTIRGVYWPARCYFAAWGLWNLFYYPNLDQWASFAGGAAIVVVNVTWCLMAWHYSHLETTLLAQMTGPTPEQRPYRPARTLRDPIGVPTPPAPCPPIPASYSVPAVQAAQHREPGHGPSQSN